MKRTTAFALGAPRWFVWTSVLLAGVGGWTAPAALADEFSKTVHFSVRMFSTGTLFINPRTGDLQIEGWDEPRVEIDAEKVVRSSSEAAARLLYDVVQIGLERSEERRVGKECR